MLNKVKFYVCIERKIIAIKYEKYAKKFSYLLINSRLIQISIYKSAYRCIALLAFEILNVLEFDYLA